MENTYEVRTQLARLLSKENITVIHGEYRTAFFDVLNRTLGLPNWKNRGKDVYDLLVGHEVGHALFTPADGWHDSDVNVQGIPRSFLNIIEDIRIERKIQNQYPGLVGSFKRGYSVLFEEDFFGTEGRDLDTYKLIDRINLKSKLGDLVDVEFSDEERPLFNKAMAVESWDDVVSVAKEILKFMQEHEEQQEEDNNTQEGMSHESDDDESMDPTGDSEGAGKDDGSDSDDSEASDGTEESSDQTDSEAGDSEAEPEHAENQDREDSSSNLSDGGYESETDSSFRDRERDLIDMPEEGAPYSVNGISKSQYKRMVIPYSEIEASRKEYKAKQRTYYSSEEYYDKEMSYRADRLNKERKQFMDENKKVLNLMVKEFEMRKAAFQYSRASTARTGSLDVNKLHTYKYNEDVFLKVMRLADAKSHGLIMYIDYSGSMIDVFKPVIKQTLLLATFCKRIGVPFDVYGFSSGSPFSHDRNVGDQYLWGDVDVSNVGILHLLSSRMKKAQYNEAYQALFNASVLGTSMSSRIEYLGGTPLNQTIMAAHYAVREFKTIHNVDKVITVFLTDGEGNGLEFGRDRRYVEHHNQRQHRGIRVHFDGKTFVGTYGSKFTSALLQNLQTIPGVMTIGIHLASQFRDARSFMWDRVPYEKHEDILKVFKRERSAHTDLAKGFHQLFLISARPQDLNPVDDEFTVDSDVSDRVLKNSFMKFAKSKKNNRKIMSVFAAAVAA